MSDSAPLPENPLNAPIVNKNFVEQCIAYADFGDSLPHFRTKTSAATLTPGVSAKFLIQPNKIFQARIILIHKNIASVEELRNENIEVLGVIPLSLNKNKDVITFKKSDAQLMEIQFSSLNAYQNHWINFHQDKKEYYFAFENQTIADEFLFHCINIFDNALIAKNTVLKYFVALKSEDASTQIKEKLKSLLLSLSLREEGKTELLRFFNDYNIHNSVFDIEDVKEVEIANENQAQSSCTITNSPDILADNPIITDADNLHVSENQISLNQKNITNGIVNDVAGIAENLNNNILQENDIGADKMDFTVEEEDFVAELLKKMNEHFAADRISHVSNNINNTQCRSSNGQDFVTHQGKRVVKNFAGVVKKKKFRKNYKGNSNRFSKDRDHYRNFDKILKWMTDPEYDDINDFDFSI
uniref:Uncharacterized protein n=1 Tax=Panagrolaimus sp. ES5 TaxID=591445 RepID=A0AC34F3L4_9BILA